VTVPAQADPPAEEQATFKPAEVKVPGALGVPERKRARRGTSNEYREARLYLVRQEYARVLASLKLVAQYGRPEAVQAAELLREARLQLLSTSPDARAAAGAISQADQSLVWCDSMTGLATRATVLIRQLTKFDLADEAQQLRTSVLGVELDSDGNAPNRSVWENAAAQTEIAIRQVDSHVNDQWINDDLQVARLRLLAGYAGAGLALILAATTIAANPSPVHGWPVHAIAGLANPLSALVSSVAIAIVGGAGGLFSALLVTQGAPATLLDFRTSVQRLLLRPIVGALVSVIVYMALSWQVVPGITVTNGGTFIVVGFATGFSERYILRLLNVDDSDGTSSAKKPPKPATPAARQTSQPTEGSTS
jgi:hypothetical protein